MRNNQITIGVIVICIAGVAALAWYQSLPHPNENTKPYWVVYVLTKNGNHTQIQSTYSNGQVTTEQIVWLDFDNKTAVHNYFKCTPSMPGCTLDGCPFTVLDDTTTEYRVRVDCPPGT